MPSGGSPLAEAFHASVWRDQRNKVEEQVAFVEKMLQQKQGQTVGESKAYVYQNARGSSKAGGGISTATAARARKIAVPSPALLGAMTAQMQQFSELVDMKVAEAEKRWSVQFKRLDERVKSLEGAFKLDEDRVTEALSSLQADVEKRDSRNVALMKKLHGIHAQELEDASAAVRKEQQSAAEGLHEDLRVQSRELIRLKAYLDEVLAQRDSTSSRVASSIDDSLAVLVSELGVRVGKLETKQYLRDGSTDSRGGGGGRGGKTRSSSPSEHRGVSSRREDRLQLTALRESLGELTLQLGDVEAEQSHLSGAVKSISASLQAEKQKRQALGLSDRNEEIASLQKKINGVGKHASKAIRGLSEGMQDIQHSILAIYSWSNSVNAKLYLPLMDYQKMHLPPPIPPAQEGAGAGEGDEKGPHAKILAALQSANAPRTAEAEKWFDL